MKSTRKIFLLFICIIALTPNFILAQTIESIENDLLITLKRIDSFSYLSLRTDATAFDSVIHENSILKEKLLRYSMSSPQMLTYDFPQLSNLGFYKATSPDHTFCIFSWDKQTGGTMHFFENIAVYEQYGKRYTKLFEKEEGTPGGFYTDIFQLTDELNTFYIAHEHRILSNSDCYQAVHTFDFEKDQFDDNFKKIKTKSGLTNTLGFSYNFFSVVDRKERPVKLISFNNKLNTITIPVVTSEGQVTAKQIVYQYDGDYFVKLTPKK
jgi:hypothetical protein